MPGKRLLNDSSTASRGSNVTRVQAALIAYGEGRILTDVVTGIDSSINDFRQLNALADLDVLARKY